MAADNDAQTGYAKLQGKWIVERPDAGGLVEEDFEVLVTALPARLGRDGGAAAAAAAAAKNKEDEGCFVALGNVKSLSRHHATIEWDFEKGCYRMACLSKNGMVVNKCHYGQGERAYLPDRSAVRVGPVTFYFQLPPQPGGAVAAPLDGGSSGDGGPDSDDEEGATNGGGGMVRLGSGGGAGGGGGGGGGGAAGGFSDNESEAGASSVGRPSVGGEKRKTTKPEGSLSYSEMVNQAFASPELRAQGESVGLTSSDVTSWVLEKFPEWTAPERRKQLQNGVQNTLTRKFVKQDTSGQLPSGQRGSRWKLAGAVSGAAAAAGGGGGASTSSASASAAVPAAAAPPTTTMAPAPPAAPAVAAPPVAPQQQQQPPPQAPSSSAAAAPTAAAAGGGAAGGAGGGEATAMEMDGQGAGHGAGGAN